MKLTSALYILVFIVFLSVNLTGQNSYLDSLRVFGAKSDGAEEFEAVDVIDKELKEFRDPVKLPTYAVGITSSAILNLIPMLQISQETWFNSEVGIITEYGLTPLSNVQSGLFGRRFKLGVASETSNRHGVVTTVGLNFLFRSSSQGMNLPMFRLEDRSFNTRIRQIRTLEGQVCRHYLYSERIKIKIGLSVGLAGFTRYNAGPPHILDNLTYFAIGVPLNNLPGGSDFSFETDLIYPYLGFHFNISYVLFK